MTAPVAAWTAMLLLLSGCIDAVALGSQCADLGDACPLPTLPGDPGSGAPLLSMDGGPNAPDVEATFDAAVIEHQDAAPPVSPGTTLDGGPPYTGPTGVLPALQNMSFEVTRGTEGPLAYSPMNPVPVGFNLAEPWSACGFGVSVLSTADAMRGSGRADVKPTNGPGFVEANLGVPALQGIRQTLDVPLQKDVRYSFAIDVRAAVGADVGLEVWSSTVDCIGASKLADVGAVPEYWQTVCLSFLSPGKFPQLFFQPSLRSAQSSGDLRIFFDNIRSDPNCH